MCDLWRFWRLKWKFHLSSQRLGMKTASNARGSVIIWVTSGALKFVIGHNGRL